MFTAVWLKAALSSRSDLDLDHGFTGRSARRKNHSPLSGQSTDRATAVCIKIGFDTSLLSEVTSAEEQPVWAYTGWQHFCLPVWGDDLTLKLPVVTLNH